MGVNLRIELFARGIGLDAIETFQALEDAEEKLADEIIDTCGHAVAIWAKSIAVLSRRLIENSREPLSLPPETDEWAAAGLRQMLLVLSISSSKAALEILISGHYSIAFAALRHMFEISIQCLYLEAFPQQHRKWYDDPQQPDKLPRTPKVGKMCRELREVFQNAELPPEDIAESIQSVDMMFEAWDYLSKGSHPTIIGVYQIDNADETGVNFIDARRSSYHLHNGFAYGMRANAALAQILLRLYPADRTLEVKLHALLADIDVVDQELDVLFRGNDTE